MARVGAGVSRFPPSRVHPAQPLCPQRGAQGSGGCACSGDPTPISGFIRLTYASNKGPRPPCADRVKRRGRLEAWPDIPEGVREGGVTGAQFSGPAALRTVKKPDTASPSPRRPERGTPARRASLWSGPGPERWHGTCSRGLRSLRKDHPTGHLRMRVDPMVLLGQAVEGGSPQGARS